MREMHYKVLLYDYKKLMTRLLLTIIPCILLLPTIILILPDNISKGILSIVLISGALMIPLTMFISLRNLYSKETIELQTTMLISKRYGEINLNDLKKVKFETYKGLRIRLYLTNGQIIGLSPYNQFKANANKTFIEFYKDLKIRMEMFNKVTK